MILWCKPTSKQYLSRTQCSLYPLHLPSIEWQDFYVFVGLHQVFNNFVFRNSLRLGLGCTAMFESYKQVSCDQNSLLASKCESFQAGCMYIKYSTTDFQESAANPCNNKYQPENCRNLKKIHLKRIIIIALLNAVVEGRNKAKKWQEHCSEQFSFSASNLSVCRTYDFETVLLRHD